MNNSVFWAEQTWPEAQAKVDAGAPVFVPLGAIEQHGYHLTLDVDVVVPNTICEQVARRTGGLVVPPMAYGNRSQPRTGGGPAFPGTLNLSAHTFSLVLRDLICELHRQRVRRIVVINGHYENVGPSVEGIELALDSKGRGSTSDLSILRMDYWEFVSAGTIERIFPGGHPNLNLEHASVLETSLMMAIRPRLVDLSCALNDAPAQFRPYERFSGPTPEVPPSGVLYTTEGSSAEKGEWLLADCVGGIVEAINEEFGLGAQACDTR